MQSQTDSIILEVIPYLRKQGPLFSFLHQNPLSQLEGTDFFKALIISKLLYGFKTHLTIAEYGEKLSIPQVEIKRAQELELSIYNKFTGQFRLYNDYLKSKMSLDPFRFEISPFLLRFFSSYYDHGLAHWGIERNRLGLFETFKEMYQMKLPFESRWRVLLSERLSSFQNSAQAIEYAFGVLKLADRQMRKGYIFNILQTLKGWTAQVIYLKEDLKDYLAVCLLVECIKYEYVSKSNGLEITEDFQKNLFCIDEVLNYCDESNDVNEFAKILGRLQETYERDISHRLVGSSSVSHQLETRDYEAYFFFCIDDREEAIRRAIEKNWARSKTFGVPGHFGLPLEFKGSDMLAARKLCPPVVQSEIYVEEDKPKTSITSRIYLFGSQLNKYSLFSPILVAALGPLVFFKLATDTFFPSISRWLYLKFLMISKNKEKLGKHRISFFNKRDQNVSPDILASFIAPVFQSVGLKSHFPSYVYIVGHASTHINNPHRYAYNCAACSGYSGRHNSELFCEILADQEVREILSAKYGIDVGKTQFVPALHDTVDCTIKCFKAYPESHKKILLRASAVEAVEKLKVFPDVTQSKVDGKNSLQMVWKRSHDIGQVRAEYGHNKVVYCVIGNRDHSLNKSFDRRSFLVSYDDQGDLDGNLLTGILKGIAGVLMGVSFDYYFSFLDNANFGAGPKFAHNISGMSGVMLGHLSDLQLGLPWQMVEIHEAKRIHVLIYSPVERVMGLCQKEHPFFRCVFNRWMVLFVKDTLSGSLYRFDDQKFQKVKE